MNVVMLRPIGRRRAPLRRGAGHGRGDGVHPGASSMSCSPSPSVGLTEIADLQAEMVSVPPAPRRVSRAARSSARRPTRTRWPRSRRSSASVVELLPRPADVPDVVEDADTLEGNARLKAAAIAAATGTAAVADDTGLEVAALGGAPGVRTARFAGEDATYADNRAKLLAAARRARPTAGPGSAPWRWSSGPTAEELAVEGVCDGTIAAAERGERGLRLRRRVRPRRRRRPHVRRDDRGREARHVAPRPGVQGAARAARCTVTISPR